MSSDSVQTNANELFDQAARMFQTAMEAGIRVQEESAKSFGQWIGQLGSPQDWQQQATAVTEQTVAAANLGISESIQLMNENTKVSLELLEKAFAAQQAAATGDGQEKTREMWETAIGAFRRNTEVVMQANSRLIDSWKSVAGMVKPQVKS